MSRLGYINIMFYVFSWKKIFTKKLFLYSRKKMSFWTYFNSKKWVYWNSFSFGNLIWKSLNVTRKKSKNKKMLVSNYIKKIKGLSNRQKIGWFGNRVLLRIRRILKGADSDSGFLRSFWIWIPIFFSQVDCFLYCLGIL